MTKVNVTKVALLIVIEQLLDDKFSIEGRKDRKVQSRSDLFNLTCLTSHVLYTNSFSP